MSKLAFPLHSCISDSDDTDCVPHSCPCLPCSELSAQKDELHSFTRTCEQNVYNTRTYVRGCLILSFFLQAVIGSLPQPYHSIMLCLTLFDTNDCPCTQHLIIYINDCPCTQHFTHGATTALACTVQVEKLQKRIQELQQATKNRAVLFGGNAVSVKELA